MKCRDDPRKQSPWCNFCELALGAWVEGVKHVNFCKMVDEDVLGEEGRPLFCFHLQEQVDIVDEEHAPFLKELLAVAEVDGLRTPPQRLVGVKLEAAQ